MLDPASNPEFAVSPSIYGPGSVVVSAKLDGSPDGIEADPLQNPDVAVKLTVSLS